MVAGEVIQDLKRLATPARAKAGAWYFKTGPGEYGEGDIFIGVTVPDQRRVAKKFRTLPLTQLDRLMKSRVHEHRLTAVFILADQYKHGDASTQNRIAKYYLSRKRYINNWDIVDSSAGVILGTWLLNQPRRILDILARSKNIWDRRIAIIATQAFIRQGQYADTLRVAKLLLHDDHDLIHKAVGWMLREVGIKSRAVEEKFLRRYAEVMPRTMLRYAIEKFPASLRARYLKA